MIVRLNGLPALAPIHQGLAEKGVCIRPAMVPEAPMVLAWVDAHFAAWRPEVEASFPRQPVRCHIAVQDGSLLGFACYDVTARNLFGPTGVEEGARGMGIGFALLLSVLYAQKAQGYAYSVIGGVGPAEFYERSVGAVSIPGSEGGVLSGMLPRSILVD